MGRMTDKEGRTLQAEAEVEDLPAPEFCSREEPQRGGENSGGGRLRRDGRDAASPCRWQEIERKVAADRSSPYCGWRRTGSAG